MDEMETLRNEVSDLSFENQCLKKDLKECTKLLKDYYDKENESRAKDRENDAQDQSKARVLQDKLREFENEHEKLKHEYERVS